MSISETLSTDKHTKAKTCKRELTSHDEPSAGDVSHVAVQVDGARQSAAGVVDARPEVVSHQLDAVSQQVHAGPAASRQRAHLPEFGGHVPPADVEVDAGRRAERDGRTAQRARVTVRVDDTSPLDRDRDDVLLLWIIIVGRPTGSALVRRRRRN